VVIRTVTVRELECVKCGYKWVLYKNGKDDAAIPLRCAKCKQYGWNEGKIGAKENKLRYQLRFTVGEWKSHPIRPHYWRTDANVNKLLKLRPSVQDMQLILEPMCYLIGFDSNQSKVAKALYNYTKDAKYKAEWLDKLNWSEKELKRFKARQEFDTVLKTKFNAAEARTHQLMLSRQLVDYFLEKYSHGHSLGNRRARKHSAEYEELMNKPTPHYDAITKRIK
jgi:hypothetical protein